MYEIYANSEIWLLSVLIEILNMHRLDFTRFNRHLIRSKLKRGERNESIQIYSGIQS